MSYIKEITVDLSGDRYYSYITAKQGDSGTRYLKITITANGTQFIPAAGTQAVIRCRKPDGTGIVNNATINENGTITVELTQQMLAVCGFSLCEIALYNSNECLTTVSFIMKIVQSAVVPDIVSSDEYKSLTDALTAIRTAYDLANDALEMLQNITIDSQMSDNSQGLVKNNIIKSYIDSGLSTKADTSAVNAALSAKLNISDIDLSLSSNSTNPVQNRTVTNKISEIADVLDTKINVSTETGTAQAELSISSDYTKMGFVYMIPYTAFDNNSQIVTIPDDQDYAQQNAWVLYLKNRQFFMSDWDNKLWTRRYETNTWTQWTQI